MTLVEMTVSMVLIGALSLALAAAMFNTRHREQRIRQSLALSVRQNNILQLMQQDIRWASQINLLQGNSISVVTSSNETVFTPITVVYFWDSLTKELKTRRGGGDITVLASNIHAVEFDSQVYDDNGTSRLRGVSVKIQFGADSDQTVTRFIETINTPEWGS